MLEDSKRRKHMGWHEHTRNLHTHTHTHRRPKGAIGSSSCNFLSWIDLDIKADCLCLQVLLYYIRCVWVTFTRKKYIRRISESTEAIPPPHSSLVSEQSTMGSYKTHSLLAQTFLLIYVSCRDWDVWERTAAQQHRGPSYGVTKLSRPYEDDEERAVN